MGYPAATPIREGLAWFQTPDGYPAVNPLGNAIGAVIMFGVLGFVPGYALAKALDRFGLLRVPAPVELAGLDIHDTGDPYPYFAHADTRYEVIEREEAARVLRHNGDGASPRQRPKELT